MHDPVTLSQAVTYVIMLSDTMYVQCDCMLFELAMTQKPVVYLTLVRCLFVS